MLKLVQGDLRVASISLLGALGYLETTLCVVALCVLLARKQWADYSSLGCLLAVRIFSNGLLTYLHYAWHHSLWFLSRDTVYDLYFYVYWISLAIESVVALIIV